MRIFVVLLLLLINACAPQSPVVMAFGDNRAWVLLVSWKYKIGNSPYTISVPRGFVTDYASIPSDLWSIYSPHDQYSRAAVIHDYLYWSQQCTREQADNLFWIAMIESEVNAKDRYVVYEAVRLFGQDAWDENRLGRKNGDVRIIPSDYIERIVEKYPNSTWQELKKRLMRDGIKGEEIQDDGSYCHIGNAAVIP